MSRIDSGKVNLGSSFVLPTSDEQLRVQELVNAKKIAAEIIEKARNQAEQIISEAKVTAQHTTETSLNEANAQIDSIHEEARQKGFQQGYEEGGTAIRNELQEKIINVEKFAQSEFELKKRIIKSAHNDIVKLVIEIADKVCKKQLNLDSEIVYNITKAAINEMKDKESVNIIVNPNMAQQIYDISEDLKKEILSLQSIRIVEDASVSQDGTIVESISSRVDNRISSQIDEIAQKLLTGLQCISEEELALEVIDKNDQHD